MRPQVAPLAVVRANAPAMGREIAGVNYDRRQFPPISVKLSNQWGIQPATATMEFASATPLYQGQELHISIAGYNFHGLCKSCTPCISSSSGNKYSLEFVDFREYMNQWDDVYGCFNQLEHKTVGGKRVRRWWHIYPQNWQARQKTYVTDLLGDSIPLTAAQILDLLFTSRTVANAWRIYHCDPSTGAVTAGYHPDLNVLPAYDINCMSGKKLGAAVQEVLDQHGILLTLYEVNIEGDPVGKIPGYDIIMARKGEGPAPAIAEASDDRKDGITLTENPSRIRIVGGENKYQLHNVALVPDWKSAWEQFFDPDLFVDYVFNHFTTPDGVAYTAIPGDVEQAVGSQLARARALEMTVREFAASQGGSAASFQDFRKFAGKPRMDMPAYLYCRMVLFRAFRLPDGFSFKNTYGQIVNINSFELVNEMMASVKHDPVTGEMTWDLDLPADGPGYAIVQGYRVGADGFKTVNPKKFSFQDWINSQDLWQTIPMQLDDSGEPDGRYILFDEPVIRSQDLFYVGDNTGEQEVMNCNAGLRRGATIGAPNVQVAMVFKAEQYSKYFGEGGKDSTVNVSQLAYEMIGYPTQFEEIPFEDGDSVDDKAGDIAVSYLTRQFCYRVGSYKRALFLEDDGTWAPGVQMTGQIDRVSLDYSASGLSETVDMTSERQSKFFERARDFERKEKDRGLFPGQKELMDTANQLRLLATALQQDPQLARDMAAALHGDFIKKIKVTTPASTTIKFGTPIWKKPTLVVSGKPTNTFGSATSSGAAYSIYLGSTVLHNEQTGGTVRYDASQIQSSRVKGPVKAGDAIGKPQLDAGDYLEGNSDNNVGTVQQDVPAGKIFVCDVLVGAAPAKDDGVFPFQIIRVSDTQIKVTKNSFLLRGFDSGDIIAITGLDAPFEVNKGEKIYLEVLYNRPQTSGTQTVLSAAICVRADWAGFPKINRVVRKTQIDTELIGIDEEFALDVHVGLDDVANDAAKATATAALTDFKNMKGVSAQWASYTLIGHVVGGAKIADGITVTDELSEFPVVVVQDWETNMMLEGFCDNNVPCYSPMPYGAPSILQVATPVIVTAPVSDGLTVTLTVSDPAGAQIYYSLFTDTFVNPTTLYSGPISVLHSGGNKTIVCYAKKTGYYDSEEATQALTP